MTVSALKTYSLKDLVHLAKKRGVTGFRAMRKDELVRAIARLAKKSAPANKAPTQPKKRALPAASPANSAATNSRARALSSTNKTLRRATNTTTVKPTSTRVLKRIEAARAEMSQSKNLGTTAANGKSGVVKDRLVVMVRGPYWLHCCWDVAPQSVQRAQAAMGQDWHAASPVLRVLRVDPATSGASERIERDIKIHGRVKNWYVDICEPLQNYRIEIGYAAPNGRFFGLARSNVVSTPAADRADLMDPHWTDVAENCEKIYAMSGGYAPEGANHELQELFEERLRRPMGSPLVNRYGAGAEGLVQRDRRLKVELEAELMVHGATHPDAYVTLQGEPIKVRPDGSFTVRCDFPNRRQVIPVVVSTRDGAQQRTVVLAIERNTKVLEPIVRDSNPNEA
ncbi:MAG TPA: DUF4912 domain-containing protein [Pirellulales bacterium]|jgi:hypothetical protein|nr:DUF4912 domain-containing protein [Pirellulales bacterium]